MLSDKLRYLNDNEQESLYQNCKLMTSRFNRVLFFNLRVYIGSICLIILLFFSTLGHPMDKTEHVICLCQSLGRGREMGRGG